MTELKAEDVAGRLEARARLADRRKAGAEFNGMPFMATEEVEIAKELRTAASLIRSLSERVERLEGALKPFSHMAGELFARNFNDSDVVVHLTSAEHGDFKLTFRDFHEARAALERK